MKAAILSVIFATAISAVPVSEEFKKQDLAFKCQQYHVQGFSGKDSKECKALASKSVKGCVIADPADNKKCFLCDKGKKLVTNGGLSVCAAIPDSFIGRKLFTFINPFDKSDLRCTYHKEWTSGSKTNHKNVLVSAPCDKLDETGIKNLISASAYENMGRFAMNLRSNKESKFNIMKFASTERGWEGECGDRDGNVQCSSKHYLNTPLTMDAEGFVLLAGREDTPINSFRLSMISRPF